MHLNFFSGMLADVAAPATAQPQAPTGVQGLFNSPIIMMGLMGVILYFMLIRPQQRRAKQMEKLLSSLKAGDRVITTSGLVGVVLSVKEKAVPPVVSLRSADAKFEILKSSVTEILEPAAAAPATES